MQEMEQWFANFNQVAKCVLVIVGSSLDLTKRMSFCYT